VSRALLIYASRLVDYEAQFPGVRLTARSLVLDGSLAAFRARCWAFAESLIEGVTENA
jgi:hypothetical protein